MKNLVPGTMGYGYFKSKMTGFWKKKVTFTGFENSGQYQSKGMHCAGKQKTESIPGLY